MAVDEVLEARFNTVQALDRPRVYAADMVQAAKSKAVSIRAARGIIARLSAESFPAAIAAAARPRQMTSIPPRPPKISETIEEARSTAAEVVGFLDRLAAEVETNPYGMPSAYMLGKPSFYIPTPAQLKQKFVASLMVIWTSFRGERIADITIGSINYSDHFIGFAVASAMPLSHDKIGYFISPSTLRRHAMKMKRDVQRFGDEIVHAVVQIVR